VTLRQLRYFVEIAGLRSFTRAAEVLHVAQSALSRQIHALEEELGVTLFDRRDRGVELTEAGERLLVRADALLAGFSRLREEVVAQSIEPQGPLAVGLPPSLRELVNVPLIHAYAQRYPNVRLNVHEGISLDLEQLVQQGRLDCALVIDLEAPRSLQSHALLSEPLYLVGPAAAALSIAVPVSIDEVASKDLILTTRPNSLRLIVENALARTRQPQQVVADFNATGLMVELVARGMAFSVLPWSAAWAALRRGELTLAPIPDLHIDWVLVARRDRRDSLAAAKLAALVREVARDRMTRGEWPGAVLAPEI
jgi:LysR family nitrogen assimilation transcriptional regulator